MTFSQKPSLIPPAGLEAPFLTLTPLSALCGPQAPSDYFLWPWDRAGLPGAPVCWLTGSPRVGMRDKHHGPPICAAPEFAVAGAYLCHWLCLVLTKTVFTT